MPQISIVIPTRDRGAEASAAARAVLSDACDLELVVVDQSADDACVAALQEIDDPRLRVIRSSLRGASNARNLGAAATSAPLLAFTDDDCRPEEGWASTMLRLFADDPQPDLIFGRVWLPPLDHPDDYAASFEPKERVQRRVPLPDEDIGIGANFGIRREVFEELGCFDALLGPGAPRFRGAEETDLLVRALHRGHHVVNAAESSVLHLGIRRGNDVRPLHVQYQFAVGAAFGKHARLDGMAGVADAARWVGFYVRKTLVDAARMNRPRPGVLYYFVAGAFATLRYRLDPKRGVFVPRDRRR
jgi:glycosyltransferase involved in cell wall biosynthesis